MRKAHQVPYALLSMTRNMQTGLYEVTEHGITYAMDLETTRILKRYFTNNERGRISEWYNQLPKEEKKTIKRSGHEEASSTDFYPDPQFE